MIVLILWDSWEIVDESNEQGSDYGDLRGTLMYCDHMTRIAHFTSTSAPRNRHESGIHNSSRSPSTTPHPLNLFLMMVLDPLSAFSVACNVLQIVETSLSVLGKAAECYKSGSPDEVSSAIGNLRTIEGLGDELRKFMPDPLARGSLSSAELRLLEANEECLSLAGDFTQLLNRLRATKKSVRHSIGSSIKTMWYKDKVAGFEKAVSERRANLTLAFLLLMQ